MVSYADIRSSYTEFYKNMRNYIWDPSAVECLADIEIECYKSIPSTKRIRSLLSRMYSLTRDVRSSDEDFAKSLKDLDNVVQDNIVYVKLSKA